VPEHGTIHFLIQLGSRRGVIMCSEFLDEIPVKQQHWILIAVIAAVFQTQPLALSCSNPAYTLPVYCSHCYQSFTWQWM